MNLTCTAVSYVLLLLADHDLHHAAYVRNLNAALRKAADSGSNLYGKTLSKVCARA
jgi:hypothetical protein